MGKGYEGENSRAKWGKMIHRDQRGAVIGLTLRESHFTVSKERNDDETKSPGYPKNL